MLKNIRCFIVFIAILVQGSFRKQGIVFSFFALEYVVEFFFFLTPASFIEIISSYATVANGEPSCFSLAARR